MAVNCEAVKQIQHEHDEHQLIQPPDNTEVQHPGGEEKRVKVLMTGVRCVALAATMAAMLILSNRKSQNSASVA